MVEFWNFKDFMTVASHYWPWLLAAGVFGLVLGMWSCGGKEDTLPEFRNAHDMEGQ